MEGVVHLDTHVVLWLYQGNIELFSAKVQQALRSHSLLISPMVLLELEYLYEIKRTKIAAQSIVDDLQARVGLDFDDTPFLSVMRMALKEKWTRDPFDRSIVTQAKVRNVVLISKDDSIRKHYPRTLW